MVLWSMEYATQGTYLSQEARVADGEACCISIGGQSVRHPATNLPCRLCFA